jgi:hypothetical protein
MTLTLNGLVQTKVFDFESGFKSGSSTGSETGYGTGTVSRYKFAFTAKPGSESASNECRSETLLSIS